jgi:farnesyl diphosphate synthase
MAAELAFARWRERIEAQLSTVIDGGASEPRLRAAMRHATLGGGKRLRALLAYAAGQACGASDELLDAPACAVECVHAFSLIHDDLPAMDDDALRRGRPTVHVAFDEATAILAGDALQALAFEVLVASAAPAQARVAQVRELAIATGAAGMCAGQSLDMQAGAADLAALEALHGLKTGALIRASVRLGYLTGEADGATRTALDGYADALGLAFQIRDDLLDVEGDAAQLGKTAGKDRAQGKSTYVSLLGEPAARLRLEGLATRMDTALAPLGSRADDLRALARFAIARSH